MRKLFIALLAIGLFGGLAGAALGHSANGSHEEDTRCLDDQTGEPVAGDPSDCPEGSTAGAHYDNQVTCAEPDADEGDVPDVETPLGGVYTTGSPEEASGGAEVCADEGNDAAPIQGRIIAQGGATDGGGFIAADGEGDNPEGNAQGWARVDISPEGVGISCGDADGNLDSTHPGTEDTQEDCG